MRKGLTEIVFILDRSGSMSGLETDTIGGYNAMLERQRKEGEKHTYQQCYSMMPRMLLLTVYRFQG